MHFSGGLKKTGRKTGWMERWWGRNTSRPWPSGSIQCTVKAGKLQGLQICKKVRPAYARAWQSLMMEHNGLISDLNRFIVAGRCWKTRTLCRLTVSVTGSLILSKHGVNAADSLLFFNCSCPFSRCRLYLWAWIMLNVCVHIPESSALPVLIFPR